MHKIPDREAGAQNRSTRQRWRALGLLLSVPWLTAFAATCPAWRSFPDPGIYWTITSPSGIRSHLLGTMHSDDPGVLAVAGAVTDTLRQSSIFAMETRLTPGATTAFRHAMHLVSGNLVQLIGPSLYARALAAYTRRGWSTTILNHEAPWAVMVTLSVPAPTEGPILDQVLARQARQYHIPVIGLETADDQIKALSGLPLAAQKGILRETLDQSRETMTLDRMITDYETGNLEALVTLSHRNNPHDRTVNRLFFYRLLHQRNQRMVRHLMPFLVRAPVFVAVGALHLPGFLARLDRAGYCGHPTPLSLR